MTDQDYSNVSDNRLIERFRAGENGIEEFLLEKYKPMVKKKARTLFIAGGDQEDLLQEGMMGLFKAIREYETGREASFSTFASLCISRYMFSAIDSSQRRKHQPLNTSISFGELEDVQADQMISTEENPETIYLEQEKIRTLMDQIEERLSPYENQVLEQYLDGLDYLQIAERMNRTPKSVDNALQRIRAKVAEINSQ